MKVQQTNPVAELLASTLAGKASAAVGAGFQSMLGDAMDSLPQSSVQQQPAGQDGTQPDRVGQSEQAPLENTETPVTEKPVKPEEETAAHMAMVDTQAEVLPMMVAEEAPTEQTPVAAAQHTQAETPVQQTEQAQPDSETPRKAEFLDQIVSAQTSQPEADTDTEIQLPQTQRPISYAPPEAEQQQRFDSLMDQASKQLQQVADAPEQAVETDLEPVQTVIQAEEPETEQPLESRTAKRSTETADVAVVETEAEPEAPKAAQPEPVAKPFSPQPQAEQIRVQLLENLDNEKMVFQMQLQPRELGKVDVRMVMEHGRLAVEIIAATPRAAQTLAKQAEGLAMSLRTANIDVHSVQVVQAAQEQSSHMDGAFNMDGSQNDQQGGETGGSPKADNGAAQEAEQPETQAPSPEGVLDYSV